VAARTAPRVDPVLLLLLLVLGTALRVLPPLALRLASRLALPEPERGWAV